ncbi:hypothetical protein KEM54_001386 [Ascosphaera aggregata]|nr:hypothetical protein KEM54_001386 [Ascosphaera aggregata]
MHVGARVANSVGADFRQTFFSLAALNTFTMYIISAWIFGEVYRWSSPSTAGLVWVKPGRPSERAKLNEAPIYLHCFYSMLAIFQSYHHITNDLSRLPISAASQSSAELKRAPVVVPVVERLCSLLPHLMLQAIETTVKASAVGPFLYMLFLRRRAWHIALYFTRLFWNFSRSSAESSGYIPSPRIFISFRILTSGICLMALWQWTNLLFSIFLSKPPTKNGKPLTGEVKNANACLINGLKAKHDLVKTSAFWELCLITHDFPDRRSQIYTDLDNNAWNEVFAALKNMISAVTTRIKNFENPPKPVSPTAEPVSEDTEQSLDAEAESTLRIVSISDKKVLLDAPKPKTQPEKFGAAFGNFARYYGQSSSNWTPKVRNKAQDILGSASKAVLSPERNKKLFAEAKNLKRLTWAPETENHDISISPLMSNFLRSKLGYIFRQTYQNRIKKIVFGSPYTDTVPLVDAIVALTQLTVLSLKEDKYGLVQRDVAAIVRMFTETINGVQHFNSERGLKVHWTDVNFPSPDSPEHKTARKVEDIDELLAALRRGLADILSAFKKHLKDVGLSSKDVRLAREAAGLPQI